MRQMPKLVQGNSDMLCQYSKGHGLPTPNLPLLTTPLELDV